MIKLIHLRSSHRDSSTTIQQRTIQMRGLEEEESREPEEEVVVVVSKIEEEEDSSNSQDLEELLLLRKDFQETYPGGKEVVMGDPEDKEEEVKVAPVQEEVLDLVCLPVMKYRKWRLTPCA